jgi:hypothetical protein
MKRKPLECGMGSIKPALLADAQQSLRRLSKILLKLESVLCLVLAVLACSGCEKRELRGTVVPSKDHGTYLVVDDDNGGKCGPILIDGKAWAHPIHAPGQIEAGRHNIECGMRLDFEIKAGTIFHFDYWGP